MRLEFEAEVFQWRGPSPYYFVAVPEPMCDDLRVAAHDVSYGWGVVPVTVQIGATSWTTSLFPKDGGYLVPLKDRVREAEDIAQDDIVQLVLTV
ncbi:MAG TPA: DUF1905 domain-containing protein [Lapillicoccus sp.]|nr:DUF1905 domain-containing protein [Lapillicoccus sp.]